MIDTDTVLAYLDEETERLAQSLDRNPAYRVLRRVPEPYSKPFDTVAAGNRVALVIDVETTGLNTESDQIIELAMMPVIVSRHGDVVAWMAPIAWLQEVDRPLSPEIQKLTSLNDEMLIGQQIDMDFAGGLLERADVVIAHNAQFDSAFIERLFPEYGGKAWACSASEIPWRDLRYEGRGLQSLLLQSGYFTDGHRAAADVWATFWQLQQRAGGTGPTFLRRLLEASDRDGVRFDARHTPYSLKDAFKSRGYYWCPARKSWWVEVAEDDADAERDWLRGIGVHGPRVTKISAKQRHRPLKIIPVDFGAVEDGDPF
jgi:DNA polymerase III subunit epsilon